MGLCGVAWHTTISVRLVMRVSVNCEDVSCALVLCV